MSNPIRISAKALIIRNESVLLVEYVDESGLHYNLPGGGVQNGESISEALLREVKEETGIDIDIGPLVFIIEYEPTRNARWAGPIHKLNMVFECGIIGEGGPNMPQNPDSNQTAVKWVRLSKLETIELLPHIEDRIIDYAKNKGKSPIFLEEPLQPKRIKRYLDSLTSS